MELLYKQEHLTCYNYEKGNRPTIEKISLLDGQSWNIFSVENKVIFIIEGSLSFSLDELTNQVISEKKNDDDTSRLSPKQ